MGVAQSAAGAIGVELPAAATNHAMLRLAAADWIRSIAVLVRAMPILGPLPHVACHVVQTPRIRLEPRHRHRPRALAADWFAVGKPSIDIGVITAEGLPLPEWLGSTGAAGVLPFRLGRQAKASCREGVQLREELLHLVEVHRLHGTFSAGAEVTRIREHDGAPLGLG